MSEQGLGSRQLGKSYRSARTSSFTRSSTRSTFRQRIAAFWHCNVHCIKADVYLFDQPSSYLDVRQRLEAAKAIRECSTSSNYVMVVEHDLAIEPQSLLDGMNRFLEILNISFRRDDESHRPRINKLDSVKDTEQKRSGNYFFLDTA
ncbi:hypothetical protein M3Y98_00378300 [Aphelenchoides besseyi]|nr:hypothetical protein M3Y98_00378300 [Aphelenchoides besseyi]